MGITMSVKSTGRTQAQIKWMAKNAAHPEAVWPTVGSYIAASNRRQWATQGAYYGKPWKPLKPDYLTWKAKQGYSKRILMQTGSMRRSFTSRPMAVEVYEGNKARFGSDHRLAKFHQKGTHRKREAREPATSDDAGHPKMRKDVKRIMRDHVMGRRTRVMRLI